MYLNDHPPSHVHVIGPGWVVVFNLAGPEMREVIGCTKTQARQVLRLVKAHRATLMEEWQRYHG